jgi:hypothetical protein
MNLSRVLVVIVAAVVGNLALAQSGERGSTPPGQSRDGAAPSDGAIKGGSILPGETAGMPDNRKLKKRCEELSGTLREDCLKQEREAAAGGSKAAEILEPSDSRKRSPARAD